MTKIVKRHEDMSPDGYLRLLIQEDGDVCLSVINTEGRMSGIEFCTCGSGGGQSPHTLKALRNLFEAMEKDNAENPL